MGLGLGSLERRSNPRLAKQCQLEVGTSASVLRAALGPFQLRAAGNGRTPCDRRYKRWAPEGMGVAASDRCFSDGRQREGL